MPDDLDFLDLPPELTPIDAPPIEAPIVEPLPAPIVPVVTEPIVPPTPLATPPEPTKPLDVVLPKEQYDMMMAEINRLAGMVERSPSMDAARMATVQTPTPTATPVSAPIAAPTAVSVPAVPMELVPFITKENYDSIIGNPEMLNRVMNEVAQQSSQASAERVFASVVQTVPFLVNQLMEAQVQQRDIREQFYKANEDLLPYSSYVGLVAKELAAANPTWDAPMVLKNTAIEARRKLNMAKGIPPATPSGFPGAAQTVGAPSGDALSDAEKHMLEIIQEGR